MGGLVAPAMLWLAAALMMAVSGGAAFTFVFTLFSIVLLNAVLVQSLSLQEVGLTRQISVKSSPEGGEAEIFLHIHCRSLFPPAWLIIRDGCRNRRNGKRYGVRLAVFPWFKSELQLRYILPALPRGEYEFLETVFSAGDLFGFSYKERRVSRIGSMVVYPPAIKIEQVPQKMLLPDAKSSANNPYPSPSATAELRGVRNYAAGDPLNRIDWKTTARTGSLKTREDEISTYGDMLVFLNAVSGQETAESGAGFETCVRFAAGLFELAPKGGSRIGFIASDNSYRSHSAHEKYDRAVILGKLASIMPDGKTGLASVIQRETEGGRVQAMLLTHRLDEAFYQEISLLPQKIRMNMAIVYCCGFSAVPWQERQCFYKLKPIVAQTAMYAAAGQRSDAEGGNHHADVS